MSSVSSAGNSYTIPVSSTTALSSVSLNDLATQTLLNAGNNLTSMQTDYSRVSARSSAYATLATALKTFIDQSPAFQDQTQVAGLTASSSSSLIGVTMGRQSVAGSYAVTVNQLAMAQVSKTTNSASATSAALYGSGNLTIKVGGNAAGVIAISNTMSATDLATAINNAKVGATAQVTGSGTSWAVQVTGNNTGAANAITFTESGTANTGLKSNLVQAAQDANYTVNGKTYTNATNTVVNGVPGVTMTLLGAVANATITVNANASQVVTSLTNFVTNYNAVIAAVNTAKGNDGLTADPTLNALLVKLGRVVGNRSSGANGTFMSLADVGILRDTDSTLSINTNTLAAASATNAASVANLLTGQALGTNGLAADVDAVVTSWGEPAVGTIGKIGTALNKRMLKMSRAETRVQYGIDNLSKGVGADYSRLQVALSKYAAQSMVVSALTAQTGISTDGYDLTKTR